MSDPKTQKSYTVKLIDGKVVLCDSLVHGLEIGEARHKDFEIREGLADDLFAADEIAHPSQVNKYDAAVICQQLIRIGDFKGPFTIAMIGKLKPIDFEILRAAMVEVETVGKPAPSAAATT